MARRREERKQVSWRRTEWYRIGINDVYAEDCTTKGAEERRHVDESRERGVICTIATIRLVSAVLVILLMIRLSHDLTTRCLDEESTYIPRITIHLPYNKIVV